MISYLMEPGAIHLVRINTGEDLLDGITEYVTGAGIQAAWLTYLGAVSRASLRYYDQGQRIYRDFELDQHLEVLSGVGNVSLLDGSPFVHTHAAFAGSDGKAIGGHLNSGTTVWALEVRIQELIGDPLIRDPDDCTSLSLWGGTL
ncbi:MAG: DNA-binding protein [Acidobacteria bacterium]|nr:DNA-binding protein [Acidobacteriota bacterium]